MPPAIVGCKGRRVELENADRRARDPCPTGKTPKSLSTPFLQKYSDLQKTQRGSIFLTIPSHQKGRYAIVTFAGRAAVDAEGATDERAQSGQRRRVDPTPRRWCQVRSFGAADDGGKKARSPR